MAQIATFWILSKKNKNIPDPLPLSRIMAYTLLSLSYTPDIPSIRKYFKNMSG
jgi:hypothetical protein